MDNWSYPSNVGKPMPDSVFPVARRRGEASQWRIAANRTGIPPHSVRRQVRRRPGAGRQLALKCGSRMRRRSAPTCGDRLAKLLADLARARHVESIREADATENHSLRRKSLLRKAIHRPRPREPHPASHGQYVLTFIDRVAGVVP